MLVVKNGVIINLATVCGITPKQVEGRDKFRLRFNFDCEVYFIDFDTAEEIKAAFDKIVADFEAGKAVCRL